LSVKAALSMLPSVIGGIAFTTLGSGLCERKGARRDG
jgi:hypothetical protein